MDRIFKHSAFNCEHTVDKQKLYQRIASLWADLRTHTWSSGPSSSSLSHLKPSLSLLLLYRMWILLRFDSLVTPLFIALSPSIVKGCLQVVLLLSSLRYEENDITKISTSKGTPVRECVCCGVLFRDSNVMCAFWLFFYALCLTCFSQQRLSNYVEECLFCARRHKSFLSKTERSDAFVHGKRLSNEVFLRFI